MRTRLLYDQFKYMFPSMVEHVHRYTKVGSKTISLDFKDGKHAFFYYDNPNNWQLGTKQWRTNPKDIPGRD